MMSCPARQLPLSELFVWVTRSLALQNGAMVNRLHCITFITLQHAVLATALQ